MIQEKEVVEGLIQYYKEQPRSVDDLPYTDDLELIMQKLDKNFQYTRVYSQREVYLTLMRLRKAGRLPRRGDDDPDEASGKKGQPTLFT